MRRPGQPVAAVPHGNAFTELPGTLFALVGRMLVWAMAAAESAPTANKAADRMGTSERRGRRERRKVPEGCSRTGRRGKRVRQMADHPAPSSHRPASLVDRVAR